MTPAQALTPLSIPLPSFLPPGHGSPDGPRVFLTPELLPHPGQPSQPSKAPQHLPWEDNQVPYPNIQVLHHIQPPTPFPLQHLLFEHPAILQPISPLPALARTVSSAWNVLAHSPTPSHLAKPQLVLQVSPY